ncbi:MAG: SH3 domain-containing protein [Lachnospiraceae bacterium]|nr:SH3 domain-containing protein [Lachnospiraceae bacterium]
MTGKKLIITGVITAGILAGIVTCITMTGKEKRVETVAEIQTADEPGAEAGTEEAEPVMEEDETVVEEEEALASLPKETVDETETDEESLQDSAEEEGTEDEGIDDLDATMYATTDVNLRQGTAVTTESLRLVNFAEEVKVTGITVNKQWYRVEDASKGVGFIASSYLSDTKPQQNASAQQTAQATSDNSSESTQSSGSGSSSVPGVSQSELDQLKADLAGLQPYTGPTGENAGGGSGGRTLNQ